MMGESPTQARPPVGAIFLSYASQDAEAAKRICDALRAAGLQVWFDQSELRGGEVWDRHIREQIHDCRLFVAVISVNTEARQEGYFRREWKLAVDRTHDMSDRMAFLVPVVIDDTNESRADVPARFREVQWTRLAAGQALNEFVDLIVRLSAGTVEGSTRNKPGPAGRSRVIAADNPESSGGGVPEKSIAVLPFTNLSSDKENEYFGDGLAEEILNALSQVPELHVAARSSTFSLKNKGASAAEIAERLRVATVLEGSVRRAADRLRITVQLIDAKTGFHLWSERYDRQLADVFEIQDEIARAIAARFKVSLAGGDTRSTANVQSYELYIRGRYEWHQRTPSSMQAALRCFEESSHLDTGNALAFAGLADCYAVLSVYGLLPSSAAREQAGAAVQRAVALAPSLWETNYTQGFHIFTFDPKWRAAQAHFQRAATINPRASLVATHLGLFFATTGDRAGVIAQANLGRQIDPLSPFCHAFAGLSLANVGELDAGELAARQALDLHPDFQAALWILGTILCRVGRAADSLPHFERLVQLSRAPYNIGWLGYGLGCAGRHEEARGLLAELDQRGDRGEFVPPVARLFVATGLGDIQAVRNALQAAIELWTPSYVIRVNAHLAPYLGDPQVARLYEAYQGT